MKINKKIKNCALIEVQFFCVQNQHKLLKSVTKELVSELLNKGKVRLDNCYSAKTGKTYNCMVMIDDDGGDFVGFRVDFLRKGKKF